MKATNKQPTLLAGEWVGAVGGEWFEDIDPADTREIVALLPRLSGDQVVTAIEAADRNADVWARASAIDRGRVLLEAASLIRERVHLPFGGFKDSGSWSKEQGLEGIDFYSRVKTVAIGSDS